MNEGHSVDVDMIVRKYIDAWNEQNVPRLLELMHPGAAYHDAFWAETCVGRELAQYFRDAMDEEAFWYEQIGDTISTKSGVVFRYAAYGCSESRNGEPEHYGAEILVLKDGKILTVTDIYCSADSANLVEVADLAERRHGLPSYTNSGLGALKTSRIKEGLAASFGEEKVHLDPNITMSQLANRIGCTLDQLSIVIKDYFQSEFSELIDAHRIEYAKGLLENDPDCWRVVDVVSNSAGFASASEFSKRFAEIVGVTPEVFCRQQQKKYISQEGSSLP